MTSDGASPPVRAVPDQSSRSPSPGPAYRIAALAARVLGMPDATLALVEGQLQGVMASTRRRSDVSGRLAARLSETVAATGAPVVLGDLSAAGHPTLDGASPSGAFLGVPVLSDGGAVVGVLYLTDADPRPLGDAEVALLSQFAALAADHLDLVRRANELEAPNERGVPALALAIGQGEIVPWYQPIIELATGRMTGVEALARWEHPWGDLDEPSVFIPLAERTNLIVDLDRIVIRQALHDLRRWQQRHPDLRLNVNLSGRHLDLDDWVDVVEELVHGAGVDPATVSLELTETATPNEAGLSVARVGQLRAAGYQVWFDDFGSGWATLQELLTFPLDGIKIDRSFAAELGQPVDNTIVRAIASTAGELGLKVTLEGVETVEQAAIALSLGCDYGQGYLWSRPVPALQLETLLITDDGLLPLLG